MGCQFQVLLSHRPWNKSLNFIVPTSTKYVIPNSLKVSHWQSKRFSPPKNAVYHHLNHVLMKITKYSDLPIAHEESETFLMIDL